MAECCVDVYAEENRAWRSVSMVKILMVETIKSRFEYKRSCFFPVYLRTRAVHCKRCSFNPRRCRPTGLGTSDKSWKAYQQAQLASKLVIHRQPIVVPHGQVRFVWMRNHQQSLPTGMTRDVSLHTTLRVFDPAHGSLGFPCAATECSG